MLKYENFLLNEKNNIKIYKKYNKILNLINPYYKYKLNLNIDYYFKIYDILFINSNKFLDKYDLLLLIILSFSNHLKDDISNIKILQNKIKERNIYNYKNTSLNILLNIYKLLLIFNKSLKNDDILFNNRFILYNLYFFIKDNKINTYNFNYMFENNLSNKILYHLKNV